MPRLLLLVPTATYRAEAFVRAARRLDIDITMASEKPNALSQYHPVDLVTLAFDDPRRSADAVKKFAREHAVHAVVGVDDQVTVAAASIGAALSLRHNPVDAAEATRNKLIMRTRLNEAGVSVPGFRPLSTKEDPKPASADVTYPCVLKPLMMAASRGVIRANTPDEFDAAFNKIRGIVNSSDAPSDKDSRELILVEDYVPGWEIAVEGILTDGKLDVLAIFDKPDPLVGPYFAETIYVTPSSLSAGLQERVIATTQQAATALGLRHGPVHAELRGDDGHLWVIEVASRSIGGYCSKVLRFEGGLTLEDVIVRHAIDERFVLPVREVSAAGVMMLQAPRSGHFEEARGVEAAGAVPGIEEIVLAAHPGQELMPLPEGFLYLGFIFARAASPDLVEGALREAHSRLDFVIA